MATDFKKITDLTQVTSLSGDELVPVVQDGVTKSATINQIFPAGFMAPYAGVDLEDGFLDCDASALSMTTFDVLWSKLHSTIGTFTVTIASPAVFTLNTHGRSTGDRVYLTTTGALPTGLSTFTTYYVVYVSVNTFRLATSLANALAGTSINTSGSQSGTHTLVYAPWGIASSTEFLLPESAEVAFVGVGTRSSGVATHDVFTQALFKDDQFMIHWHSQQTHAYSAAGGSNTYRVALGTNVDNGEIGPTAGAIDGGAGTPRAGSTTRTKEVGVRWMIKY